MTANTTLEQRFIDLQNANLTLPKYLAIPKIQKVASDLRNRKDFEKHYSPKLVSMGPIHHGRSNLELGEKYKLQWAAKFIEKIGKNPKDLYQNIANNINKLKGLFADDVLTSVSCEGFDNLEEKLSWMLLVDGCSLLHILDIFVIEPENIMFDKLYLVLGDVLLLENQLPFKLFKRFPVIKFALIRRMIYFLQNFCFQYKSDYFYPEDSIRNMKPIHLLDLLRQILLPKFKRKNQDIHIRVNVKENDSVDYEYIRFFETYLNIQEMRAKGIRVNKKGRSFDISFSHGWLGGELKLPEFTLNDITVSAFLNLIAYEMCPDFKNDYEISTFFAYMDSIIRQPEDVKDLRSAGILLSNFGSDEELVKLFHFLATDVVPNPEIYFGVSFEINKHVTNKLKTNMVRFLAYIRHPWTSIAVHAAELGLAIAFVQTWFTAHPPK